MGIHAFSRDGRNIVLDVNSGNVFEVDKPTFDVLGMYPKTSEADIAQALRGVYTKKLISEIVAEIDILISSGRLHSKPPALPDPANEGTLKAICLNVTHDCNLRCKYCFASGGDFSMGREVMPPETALRAVDFLISRSGARRNLEVDFFGGEPLMNFDVMRRTVEYARDQSARAGKSFRFTVTTNATLINDEILEFFDREIHNVVLSLDGRKKTNDAMRVFASGAGSYDAASSKISGAVASRGDKSFYVRSTFTSRNLDFADDVAHLASLGYRRISAEPVIADPGEPYAIREEHLPRIFEEYDKLTDLYLSSRQGGASFEFFHFNIDLENEICAYKRFSGCGAGSEYVAVTPSGAIYPCHQFVGLDGFVMGDVNTGEFDAAMSRDLRARTSVAAKKGCRDCWALSFCSGGCHAAAYKSCGELEASGGVGCEMLRKRLECALYIKCVEKSLITKEKPVQS